MEIYRITVNHLVLWGTYLYIVYGYPRFQTLIPNGDHVINPCGDGAESIWNGVGHTNKRGGGPLNQFGRDFRDAGYVYFLILKC